MTDRRDICRSVGTGKRLQPLADMVKAPLPWKGRSALAEQLECSNAQHLANEMPGPEFVSRKLIGKRRRVGELIHRRYVVFADSKVERRAPERKKPFG